MNIFSRDAKFASYWFVQYRHYAPIFLFMCCHFLVVFLNAGHDFENYHCRWIRWMSAVIC